MAEDDGKRGPFPAELLAAVDRLARERRGAGLRIRGLIRGSGAHGESWLVRGGEIDLFLKAVPEEKSSDLDAELLSLRRLEAAQCLRVPEPIGLAAGGGMSCLVLEALDLRPPKGREPWRELGKRLARLHSRTVAELNGRLAPELALPEGRFGVDLPSSVLGCAAGWSAPGASWADSFADARIAHQLERAQAAGFDAPDPQGLVERCREALAGDIPPSLVHGDLWAGNVGFAGGAEPVAYDPAAFLGDGESDLAMAELFGGFGAEFFEGYRSLRPGREGYGRRRGVYWLYHLLNHFNLFGGGYREQAQAAADSVLRGGK